MKEKLVEFTQNDPEDPRQWPTSRKWTQVTLLTILTFMVQYSGSSFSTTERSIARELEVCEGLSILGLSALLLAYAVAPMMLAPLAESFGRKWLYIIGYFLFLLFTIPTASTHSISVLIVFRFFVGCAGSVGNTMIGGSITDMFDADNHGPPMSVYIILGLLSSTPFGVIINGFVVDRVGYKWVFWIQCIVGLPVLLSLLFLRETRPVVILRQRAKKLGEGYAAEGDGPFWQTVSTTLQTPWSMMFTDVIVAVFSIWLAFAWGVSYGLLQSVALVFRTEFGFTASQVGLVFLSPLIALLLAAVAFYLQESRITTRRLQGRNSPELRLEIACFGSIAITAGLFFYGWTSRSDVSYLAPTVAVGLVFFGISTIYYSVFLYICDNFADKASSALSAAGFWRNLLAAAFPLFTDHMYRRLGYNWASSLLGFVSIPIGMVPFALYIYGPKLRNASKWIE